MRIFLLIIAFTLLHLPAMAQDLSRSELNALFKREVHNQLKKLEYHLQKMVNKKIPKSIRLRYKKNALKFFATGAKMQVSSKNSNYKANLDISRYFQRLINLPYAKVKIGFKDQWVSNARKNRDGSYTLKGAYLQFFKGYAKDGTEHYEDLTAKEVDVRVEVFKDIHGIGLKVLFKDTIVLWTE